MRKGMYSFNEKSGLLRKLSLSWGMLAAYPALSMYSRTISRKLDSLATAKDEVILLSNCDCFAILLRNIALYVQRYNELINILLHSKQKLEILSTHQERTI